MGATGAEFGKTSEQSLKGPLVVCLFVVVVFIFFLLFLQFVFYIGLFKPFIVRCNTSLYH